MARDKGSTDSMIEATRSRSKFSGHGNSLGAAGVKGQSAASDFLKTTGDTYIFQPHEHGYEKIIIGAAWDEITVPDESFLGKILKKEKKQSVDLDIGCLYELTSGERGCVQAFGDMYGDFDNEPYISLSGDERTGITEGHDEYLEINGPKWSEIKRILIYVYIYDGAPHWSEIKPQILIDMPGENDLLVIPDVHNSALAVCAIGGLENVRGGIKVTNFTEYFPGHAEMDRAFGFGIEWTDGQKT